LVYKSENKNCKYSNPEHINMSGNTILDSMNKNDSVATDKILQAPKVLGANDYASKALLTEAERELGIGNEPTRPTEN
jgi:hypothetical protein